MFPIICFSIIFHWRAHSVHFPTLLNKPSVTTKRFNVYHDNTEQGWRFTHAPPVGNNGMIEHILYIIHSTRWNKMCLWHANTPVGNIVQYRQKSQSPTFWPCCTPGACNVTEVLATPTKMTFQVWELYVKYIQTLHIVLDCNEMIGQQWMFYWIVYTKANSVIFNFPYHFTLWVGQGWIIGYWSI